MNDLKPTTWIPAEEECARPREHSVWGSRVEDNKETKSGVATVWDQGREGHEMRG